LAVSAVLYDLAPRTAHSARWQAYDAELFDRALAEGRPVLVDVYAKWCPVCRRQLPILDAALARPGFGDVLALVVDFDEDTEFLRAHRISRQATIVLFVHGKERVRIVADTNPRRVMRALEAGLDQRKTLHEIAL